MNAKNAEELLDQPDVDGGLIGGASLKPGRLCRDRQGRFPLNRGPAFTPEGAPGTPGALLSF